MELISIIMSVYNEKIDWLKEAVESIMNQTYKNIELIIINDNPENKELIDYLINISILDNRITVFFNEENKGLVFSLNFAIQQCNGNYIARMDADDVSKEDRITKQFNYLVKTNSEFVYSNVDLIDENSNLISLGKNVELKTEQIGNISKYGNPSKHPTWFMKKEVYLKLSGYRDISFVEDYDFFLRALNKGIKISQMPYNVVLYRYRESSISRSNALYQFKMTEILKKLYKNKEIQNNKFVSELMSEQVKSESNNALVSYSVHLMKRDEAINKIKNKQYISGFALLIKACIQNNNVLRNTLNIVSYKRECKKIRRI